MSRAVTRCNACRFQVLDSFAALAGVSLRLPLPPQVRSRQAFRSISSTTTISNPPPIQYQSQSRPYSSTSTLCQTPTSQQETISSPPPESNSQPEPQPSIPWYLQVETPAPPAPTSPLLALYEIPEIPPDAPEILLPMLNHLSTQIGLDNLSLLDLRHLDPPPALGANLIMVLGTARSYKHLNTSADRFCRWLRSRYKLSPYADGLLGRNELKLKLRRKARKMKLAQSVGNTVAMSEVDDGITTGWICVNVGSVEDVVVAEEEAELRNALEVGEDKTRNQEELGAEDEYQNPTGDEYIGFGSRSTAPKIVVQMFTEDKRLEMDLEGLWDVRMERKAKKAQKADVTFQRQIEDAEEQSHPMHAQEGFKPYAG